MLKTQKEKTKRCQINSVSYTNFSIVLEKHPKTSVMQTEGADCMHKLRADEGISGHLLSGIVEQDRKGSIPLATRQFSNKQTNKSP